ncbi:MAG: BREX-4 system phosphatase PglZ [Candidatus Aminicenantes bacterium]|nr:BREX-4 system phosphatase PglZ [Candidatus Aminicenantes bacterium]
MPIFNNIDELLVEIEADKSPLKPLNRRFAVRFIFLYSFSTLKELVVRLVENGVEKLELGSQLPHADGWFTKDTLIQSIERIEKSSIVLPFSEVARFFDKENFRNLFNRLAIIDNSGLDLRRRIYLPLIGLKERFYRDFFEGFYRKDECAPIWEIHETNFDAIEVFVYDKPIEIAENFPKPVIPNATEWLNIWKNPANPSFLCFSESLCYYFKNTLPDQIFDIKKIDDKKDFIETIFNLEIPIPYDPTDDRYWDILILKSVSGGFESFREIVKKELNLSKIEQNTIIKLWLENKDDFKRWLLKGVVLSREDWQETYLYKAFERLEGVEDAALLKNFWLSIFDLDSPNKYIRERELLLKIAYKTKNIPLSREFENKIESRLNEIKEIQKRINLLTGILPFEKRMLLETRTSGNLKNLELIEEKYPHLHYYAADPNFDDLEENCLWVKEYFKEYKTAKLSNRFTENIQSQINKLNHDESSFYNWYYSFPSVRELLTIYKPDKIICIDALGVEWVALIENILEQKGYHIEKRIIGRANLPTITEFNKFEGDYIRDFDKLIHDYHFSYPHSIITEIDKVVDIIDKNVVLDKDKRAAIISDHGLSSLVRIGSRQKHNFEEAKHDGRYISIPTGKHLSGGDDYIIHENDSPEGNHKKYMLASKHNSLNKKPSREVHGGCTPEEVLVPVIIISTKISTLETKEYKIQPLNFTVQKKDPVISIEIDPNPTKSPYLRDESGKRINLKYNPGKNRWQTGFHNFKPGKHTFELSIDSLREKVIVEITSGYIEEKLF